jgi:hypothetical protein
MPELTQRLNELASTDGLSAQGAANVWAGTDGLSLIGALNALAETSGLGINAVCNAIAGTDGLSAVEALEQATSGGGGSTGLVTELVGETV